MRGSGEKGGGASDTPASPPEGGGWGTPSRRQELLRRHLPRGGWAMPHAERDQTRDVWHTAVRRFARAPAQPRVPSGAPPAGAMASCRDDVIDRQSCNGGEEDLAGHPERIRAKNCAGGAACREGRRGRRAAPPTGRGPGQQRWQELSRGAESDSGSVDRRQEVVVVVDRIGEEARFVRECPEGCDAADEQQKPLGGVGGGGAELLERRTWEGGWSGAAAGRVSKDRSFAATAVRSATRDPAGFAAVAMDVAFLPVWVAGECAPAPLVPAEGGDGQWTVDEPFARSVCWRRTSH
jgi:hypothetical protein